MGRFTPSEPAGLLARSYYELLESKQPILGIRSNLWFTNFFFFFFFFLHILRRFYVSREKWETRLH